MNHLARRAALRRARRATFGLAACAAPAFAAGAQSVGAAPAAAAVAPAAGAPASPAAVAVPRDSLVAAAPLSPAAAARAAALPVRAGDRVRVGVWREPTLSGDFIVNERGEAVFPQLGTLHIAGVPLGAVRDTLLARYAVYLRNPSIDVTVFRRVGVQGEVRLPNTYYVDATKTMREVVTEAGGPLETAKRDHIALVRDGRTVAVTRLDDEGAQGIELRSGDQVVVARRSWLSINALGVVSTLGVIVPVGLSLINYLRK